jgi:hypothetical protein
MSVRSKAGGTFSLFPASIIPLLIYNIAAWVLYDYSQTVIVDDRAAYDPYWDQFLSIVTLPSGAVFALTYGQGIVLVAVIILIFSIMRASRTGSNTIIGNMVGVVVLCIYIVQFLAVDYAGTATFLMLTLVALVDTLASISVGMVSQRSDLDVIVED